MFDNVVTHIADDRQLRDHLHDPEPDADVLCPEIAKLFLPG